MHLGLWACSFLKPLLDVVCVRACVCARAHGGGVGERRGGFPGTKNSRMACACTSVLDKLFFVDYSEGA